MRRPALAILLAALALIATAAPGRAGSSFPRVFGADERFSSDISPFTNWTGVLERTRREMSAATRPCDAAAAVGCEPAEWRAALQALAGLSLRQKLEYVNARMNGHPYVPSLVNWGKASYWETPFEFLRRNGQCQDYAIAKFMLLRAAGVPNEQMRVVVVRDTMVRLDHAVLLVDVEGEALVLDNQAQRILPVEQVRHYIPYYSINESGWWQHIGLTVRTAESRPTGQRS